MSESANIAERRRRKRKRASAPGGLELAGTALNVFGSLPLEIHLLYYAGTFPFVIAFLYFWFDMSQSAFAGDRLIVWSLLLPPLFIWMKCWQSVFVNTLNSWLYEGPVPKYTFRGIIRLITFNTIVQPLGFIAMPLAMIFGFPFMAAGFFFQDVLLSKDLYQEGVFKHCVNSLRCSRQNPGQGFVLIWLFSPWQVGAAVAMICFITFVNRYLGLEMATAGSSTLLAGSLVFQIVLIGCVLSPLAAMLASGIAVCASLIPWLLEHLLGVETPLSHGYGSMLSNTSFIAVQYFLVFLILDPLMKIATLIRRFQFVSRSSGEDILVALKEFIRHGRGAAGVLLVLLFTLLSFMPGRCRAETMETSTVKTEAIASTPVQKQKQLDAALDETLRKPRYTWRMPRELGLDLDKKDEDVPGWVKWMQDYLKKTSERIRELMERFGDWLKRIFDGDEHKGWKGLNIGFAEGLFYILLAGVLITILVMLLKWLRTRRKLMAVVQKPAAKVQVDIHDHGILPDALPPDEWLDLAGSLVGKGDYRAAMRALFLGVLAKLGEADLITLRAYKSNYDYRRELELRARGQSGLIDTFRWLCRLMECTWYGFVPVTEQMWNDYQLKSAGLRQQCGYDPDTSFETEAGL